MHSQPADPIVTIMKLYTLIPNPKLPSLWMALTEHGHVVGMDKSSPVVLLFHEQVVRCPIFIDIAEPTFRKPKP